MGEQETSMRAKKKKKTQPSIWPPLKELTFNPGHDENAAGGIRVSQWETSASHGYPELPFGVT